ncbi:MAG: Dabb family protein [Bacteroidales bacterium]|nr:Dabb family protein [Bacteroidales bacterium]MBN2819200.1 Dabb family protein [Bacteroidales bacterium]
MVKHIVMWKLDASYSETEKKELVKEFESKLLQLEGKISVLKSIAVHFNSPQASDKNFDILLDTSFSTMDDLETYRVHPEHQKVVKWVGELKLENRACVDYEN